MPPVSVSLPVQEDVVTLYFASMGLNHLAVAELIHYKCGSSPHANTIRAKLTRLKTQNDIYDYEKLKYRKTRVGHLLVGYMGGMRADMMLFKRLTSWGANEKEVVAKVNQHSIPHFCSWLRSRW